MTISPRVLPCCLSFAVATAALAADPPDVSSVADQGSAPETVKVASAESVAAGAPDRKFAFVIIKSEAGQCYAVVPPGGEGIVAGDSYALVAATDADQTTRDFMTKDHPNCKVVDVVARVAK
jgi:hypothetical protein